MSLTEFANKVASRNDTHQPPITPELRDLKHGEGYVFPVYGPVKYLKMALAAVQTLRRYDTGRPVALACESEHIQVLEKLNVSHLIDDFILLRPQHRSIVGFKHNVWQYQLYQRTLFLDCDMVFCKNPDCLWQSLAPFNFTATGSLTSDPFFGGPKGFSVLKDILFQRRRRTLERFGLTYLNRVQSGLMFVQDNFTARRVCEKASICLSRMKETHFQTRLSESGRTEESCEWSLAMAMSMLNIPVYPWLIGQESAQLDFISDLTEYDASFELVTCTVHTAPFVYALRGMRNYGLRRWITSVVSNFSGRGDYLRVTPYILHFGWLHEKKPFMNFADQNWVALTKNIKQSSQFPKQESYKSLVG